MRLFTACLSATLAFGTAFAPLAQADTCLHPTEHEAFEVSGLKNELMVLAIACQNSASYNAFIMQFRPTLLSEEKTLAAYFNRTTRNGQKARDDYITNLANSQSEESLTRGTLFCSERAGLFNEVQQLRSSAELVAYAHAKQFKQPIDLIDCPVTTPVATTKTVARPKIKTPAN
jgi:hypothetical protein